MGWGRRGSLVHLCWVALGGRDVVRTGLLSLQGPYFSPQAFPPQATPAAHHRKWGWRDQAQPRPH